MCSGKISAKATYNKLRLIVLSESPAALVTLAWESPSSSHTSSPRGRQREVPERGIATTLAMPPMQSHPWNKTEVSQKALSCAPF